MAFVGLDLVAAAKRTDCVVISAVGRKCTIEVVHVGAEDDLIVEATQNAERPALTYQWDGQSDLWNSPAINPWKRFQPLNQLVAIGGES